MSLLLCHMFGGMLKNHSCLQFNALPTIDDHGYAFFSALRLSPQHSRHHQTLCGLEFEPTVVARSPGTLHRNLVPSQGVPQGRSLSHGVRHLTAFCSFHVPSREHLRVTQRSALWATGRGSRPEDAGEERHLPRKSGPREGQVSLLNSFVKYCVTIDRLKSYNQCYGFCDPFC